MNLAGPTKVVVEIMFLDNLPKTSAIYSRIQKYHRSIHQPTKIWYFIGSLKVFKKNLRMSWGDFQVIDEVDWDDETDSSGFVNRFLVLVEIIKEKGGDFKIEVVIDIFVVAEAVKEEFGIMKESVDGDFRRIESKSQKIVF